MRILFINKASFRFEGGAEIRSREVAKRLVEKGHEVFVLCAKTDVTEPAYQEFCGVKIYYKKVMPDFLLKYFPTPHYLPLALSYVLSPFYIARFLKRNKIDLMRDSMSPLPASSVFFFFQKQYKRYVVLHWIIGPVRRWIKLYGIVYGMAGYVFEQFLKSGILGYTKIIVDGLWIVEKLAHNERIAHRVQYIPNGVDTTVFSPRRNSKRTDGDLRLLNIARFSKHKGHIFLIQAMRILAEKYPQVKLYMLGDGPTKREIKKGIAAYRLSQQMIFLEKIPFEEMPKVYHQYDVFILPSVMEGLPITLLEAMATKLPIIATKIPAHLSVLDDSCAILVEPENVNDLARGIELAITDPELLRRNAEKAYERVKAYDWSKIAEAEIEGLE